MGWRNSTALADRSLSWPTGWPDQRPAEGQGAARHAPLVVMRHGQVVHGQIRLVADRTWTTH
jgi:hypothetical protein